MLDMRKAYSHADRLSWAIENLIGTARYSYYNEQEEAHAAICREARELSGLLLSSIESVPSELSATVESLLRVVQWLKVAGYDPGIGLDRCSNCPEIPPKLSELLLQAKISLNETITRMAEVQLATEEVKRAQIEDLFEEYVGRCPGKGALSSIGPFITTQKWRGDPDQGPVSWTEATVFKYPNNRWIIREEDFHRELSGRLLMRIREVRESEAARLVMSSEIELDVTTLSWAKSLATGSADAKDSKVTSAGLCSDEREPSDDLQKLYRDPDNYRRNIWLYGLRKAGKTNPVILAELNGRAEEFTPLESENALRSAIDTIAGFHNWPPLKGKPGRPKASVANHKSLSGVSNPAVKNGANDTNPQ